ncbi:cytochrome c3 family protein [uncultured Desulfuromonas sp.]|uniref:cytochrome c3 family protein n=1 Tax=uncultured Desulfuromonas sp. TaxID=181013 RepID=UPI002AAAFBF4|nr:cytochrome c3 family protein [uncultured Desulfuromonas sp.]
MKKSVVVFGLFLTMGLFFATNALAQEALTDADCVKCHINAVKDVAAHGAAHADMGCRDCHLEHPPLGDRVIPECTLCHAPAETAHYTLDNCVGCHYPHHPLEIDFTALDNVKPACVSCHPAQGEEMAARPSLHSEQDCNACHNAHGLAEGQYQNCLDCHEGHSESMTVSDCTLCHKPHSPKEVTYNDLPSELCAACHEDIAAMLAKSTKKHHELTCSECHVDEHMTITPCIDCHGKPHGIMHEKYPTCVECHIDPHALAE